MALTSYVKLTLNLWCDTPIHYNELLGVRSLIAIHMNSIMSAKLENFEFIKRV